MREVGEPVDVDGTGDGGLLRKVKGQLSHTRFPGSDAWARMDADDRLDWWVGRVGRLTALVTSFTGLAGAVGERLPLQDMLGTAGQGLLLCAIASERGIDDVGTRVRLLGAVLFHRDIDPVVAAGSEEDEVDEEMAARLVPAAAAGQELETAKGEKFGVKVAANLLWSQGKMLTAIRDELEKRPKGGAHNRALGKLPVVGMAGTYLGERSALKRCAKDADRWIASAAG
ncbi:hypothetical protein ABZ345_17895 [Lentzea sp. NPDC005914]|uniref:hypothetical protein n=1 Tax=Lentzea sp. NPDC005914 TaxID=3154572 RepID=UPI003400706D